jgi:predicted permease
MPNLRHAFRTLFKTPFITAIAVLSLALGIGANAAIFSLFDQMLLQALPVEEPGRLVNLEAPGPKPGSQSCNDAGDCEAVFSYPMFRDLEQNPGSFSGVAAHRAFGANLAIDGRTASSRGMLVSGSYFGVLGLQPALGRLFTEADDQAVGEHFVAVLSHGYWERELGSDPGVLNGTIIVNGHSMTVVGVAPAGFQGTTLGSKPDVFVPITMRNLMEPGFDSRDQNRRAYWAYLFARLGPGVPLEAAAAEINSIYSGIINEVEAPLQEGMSDATMERFRARQILVTPGQRGQSNIHREARIPLIFLLSVTGLVLVIACANIANLLLARGAQRSHEMAIRGSMGASRSQMLGQLLTESILLAMMGGAASILVASWTLSGIRAILPPEASSDIALTLQPSVFAFAAALSIGTGILFGLYPALHSTRSDLVTILKASTGHASGVKSAARFRTGLVTAQVALSMALLVGAGLFIKSLVNVSRIDLGLDTGNIVAFGISPELNGYEGQENQDLFIRTEAELAAIPGVTGVTASLVPILSGSNWGTDVRVEGFESGPDIDSNARFNIVGPGYFSTLGMPLIAGREFTEADAGEDTPEVAVVNEAFIEKFGLDGANAVGKWMSRRGGGGDELDIEIVGVVQDARYSEVKQAVPPMFFIPYRQVQSLGALSFYVRTGMEPSAVIRAVPEVMKRLDGNLPVENLKTLEQQAKESVFLDRMISTLASAFAVLATLLAGVGLYGVLAYSVAQRTREIGLRMALGAGSKSVRSMILRQVVWMIVVGGVVGIAGALALGRLAQSLLFGLEGHDPAVVSMAALLLGGIALAAGYLPALRASRVDPMKALRHE